VSEPKKRAFPAGAITAGHMFGAGLKNPQSQAINSWLGKSSNLTSNSQQSDNVQSSQAAISQSADDMQGALRKPIVMEPKIHVKRPDEVNKTQSSVLSQGHFLIGKERLLRKFPPRCHG
jgi:hypothetical protein